MIGQPISPQLARVALQITRAAQLPPIPATAPPIPRDFRVPPMRRVHVHPQPENRPYAHQH